MMNTDQFALLFERRLYLSEIAVSSFARHVTFRTILVWFSGFGFISTGRDRGCASLVIVDG